MAVGAPFDKLDAVPECPSAKPYKPHDASTDNVQNSSRRFCHYYSPSKGLRLSQWQPKCSWKEYQHACVGFQSSNWLITGPKRNLHRDRQHNEQHFWLFNRPISSTSPSQGHWFHILFVISLALLVRIHRRNFPSSDNTPKILPRNAVPVCSHQTPQKSASSRWSWWGLGWGVISLWTSSSLCSTSLYSMHPLLFLSRSSKNSSISFSDRYWSCAIVGDDLLRQEKLQK